MKNLFILILLGTQLSSNAQHKPFVPLEYEYPQGILATPKTYVFQNTSTSDLRYKDIKRTNKPGQVIINWKEYDATPMVDSSVEINDKSVEEYVIINGQKFKGDITEDSIHHDGSRLGEKFQAGSLTVNPVTVVSYTGRSRFLKDTAIMWKGKRVPCLVIVSDGKQAFTNPQDPSATKENAEKTIYYFGKDVGLLQYETDANGEVSVWRLKEIKKQN